MCSSKWVLGIKNEWLCSKSIPGVFQSCLQSCWKRWSNCTMNLILLAGGFPLLTWAQGRWGGFHGPGGLVTRMGAGMSTFVCHGVWLLETQTGFPFRFPQEDGRRGDRVLCVGCVAALPCGCGRGIYGFPFISVPFDLKCLANDQGISGWIFLYNSIVESHYLSSDPCFSLELIIYKFNLNSGENVTILFHPDCLIHCPYKIIIQKLIYSHIKISASCTELCFSFIVEKLEKQFVF